MVEVPSLDCGPHGLEPLYPGAPEPTARHRLPALPEMLLPSTRPAPVPQCRDTQGHLSAFSAFLLGSPDAPGVSAHSPWAGGPPPHPPPTAPSPVSLVSPGLSFPPAPPPRPSHLDQVRAISWTGELRHRRRRLRSDPGPVKAEAVSSCGRVMVVRVLGHLSLQVAFQREVLSLHHVDSRQDCFPQR